MEWNFTQTVICEHPSSSYSTNKWFVVSFISHVNTQFTLNMRARARWHAQVTSFLYFLRLLLYTVYRALTDAECSSVHVVFWTSDRWLSASETRTEWWISVQEMPTVWEVGTGCFPTFAGDQLLFVEFINLHGWLDCYELVIILTYYAANLLGVLLFRVLQFLFLESFWRFRSKFGIKKDSLIAHLNHSTNWYISFWLSSCILV
jgi:hypothetical protein